MDHVLTWSIEPFVPLESCGACDIRIVCVFVIDFALHQWHHEGDDNTDNWHYHIDCHRKLDLQADIDKPQGHIIVEGTFKVFGNLVRLMFSQVCIDEQDDEAGVRKLCQEHTSSDCGFLLTRCFLTDVYDHVKDCELENNID